MLPKNPLRALSVRAWFLKAWFLVPVLAWSLAGAVRTYQNPALGIASFLEPTERNESASPVNTIQENPQPYGNPNPSDSLQ
ncbi:MAG: hypothetical protein EBR22_02460, partial [Cytophagia bacterium]|nr:hypothetical protein [Cytophagia bacterium]